MKRNIEAIECKNVTFFGLSSKQPDQMRVADERGEFLITDDYGLVVAFHEKREILRITTHQDNGQPKMSVFRGVKAFSFGQTPVYVSPTYAQPYS